MAKVHVVVASTVALVLAGCRTTTPPVDTPPATPSGVVAEARDGGFTLGWRPNTETDLEGYAVTWGKRNAPVTGELFVSAPNTSVDVTGLVNGTSYEYGLAAVDRAGNESPAATGVVTPVDMGPPTVTGTAFEVNRATHRASLLLSFSEAMDEYATAAAVSLTPTVSCTWKWTSATELSCANFVVVQNGSYALEVTASAVDLAGNPLVEQYTSTFEVGDLLPRLTSVAPELGALHVDPMSPITLAFSEPVTSVVLGRWFLVSVDGAAVPGDAAWSMDKTGLTFTPSAPYGYSKLVTWTVAGVIDFDGNDMTPLPEGSFTTEFQVGSGG